MHRHAGRLVEAVAELELVVALDAAVQHPDLEADTAMLEQVRAELAIEPVGQAVTGAGRGE